MSRWAPCKRSQFVQRLRAGLYQPSQEPDIRFMVFDQYRLTLPSNAEYSVPQPRTMLAEVEVILGRAISREEWSEL